MAVANWNLSVDLRGSGNSLANALRQNATHARTLAAAARDAEGAVADLGQASNATAGRVRSLGSAAGNARREIDRLGSAAQSTEGNVTAMGTAANAAQTRLTHMARQARDAAGDLRQLAAAAALAEAQLQSTGGDVRITAELDDQTGVGLAAVRAGIDDIQHLSPIRLSVDLDAAGAAAALNAVQGAADDTSRALLTLRTRATGLADALDELRNRAILAAGGLTLLGGAANNADGHMNSLSGRTRTLRSDMDDLDGSIARLVTRLGTLPGTLGSSSSSANNAVGALSKLKKAALLMSPALIPIAASAVLLAAGVASAGVGVGVFGVAIAGQIKALTDAADAQQKYDDAVRLHGKASPEAAKAESDFTSQMQKMPPATRQAAAGLSSLKTQYRDWSDSLSGDTMPVATKGFAILADLFPKMTPLVKGTSRELDRFMNIAAGGVRSDGLGKFMDSFAEFSETSLRKANDALIHFTRTLDTGKVSGGVSEFMTYAKENGPLVGQVLTDLSKALVHVLVAGSDVGVGLLQVVSVLTHLVSAVPTEAITALLQIAFAIKAVQLAAAGGSAISGVLTGIATSVGAMRVAAAGSVGPLAAMTAALATLSRGAKIALVGTAVGAVVLALVALSDIGRKAPVDVDKLTTSLGKLGQTGKVSGEAAKAFGSDLSGLADSLRMISRPSVSQGIDQWIGDLINIDTRPISDAKKDLDGVDKALAGLVKDGHADLAAAALKRLGSGMAKNGMSSKELNSQMGDYKQALADAAFEAKLVADSQGLFGDQAQKTSAKLADQKASADGLRGAIQALNDVQRAGLGGMIGFEAAIDAASKAAKDNAGALTMTNGVLNLNSEKARNGATALQDLASKTDEATGAARESGSSWETVNGIYERGRQKLIEAAMQMGLTGTQAQLLAGQILTMPDKKSTTIEMRTEDAINGLNSVISAIKKTPGAKSVRVAALTADAVAMLESLGYKVKQMPDGSFTVSAITGGAKANVAALQAARDRLKNKTVTLTAIDAASANARAAQRAIDSLHGKTVTIHTINVDATAARNAKNYRADGGVDLYHYAAGGLRENHVAQIAQAGTIRMWAEPETMGESYIPLAPSKRGRSRKIAEETVRRLGGKGIAWNAQGSISSFASGGFSYTPTELASLGTQDARGRFDDLVGKLRDAWSQYNDAVKSLNTIKKDRKSTAAQRSAAQKKVNAEYADVKSLDSQLGLPSGAKAPTTLNLTAYAKQLTNSVAATQKWQTNLAKIGARGGKEVEGLLQDMGAAGYSLVNLLAGASTKQFKDITANLLKVGQTAKATLADFTTQANAATKTSATFQANLAKLAGMGYGDLATQLAGQGDAAAQSLAAEAVTSSSKASAANKAATAAGKTLSSDELAQLVQIIAAVKTSKTGIHAVAAATGLGEDDIIATAGKASAQIKSSLGDRAAQFLADLARGQKGMSYANGGIRAGVYATQGGAVTFAEPSTGGEAYIPLGSNKRSAATNVLRDVAGRFGVGLTDMASTRPVVIVQQAGDTHITVPAVRTGASATDIASQVGRSMRRASRGGVGARV